MKLLLSPAIAFIVYFLVAVAIYGIGRVLAGAANPSKAKSSIYGSGEEASSRMAAPGYTPFFRIAFFFTVLHLGVLVVGAGELKPVTGLYIVGLMVCLLAFGADKDTASED